MDIQGQIFKGHLLLFLLCGRFELLISNNTSIANPFLTEQKDVSGIFSEVRESKKVILLWLNCMASATQIKRLSPMVLGCKSDFLQEFENSRTTYRESIKFYYFYLFIYILIFLKDFILNCAIRSKTTLHSSYRWQQML